MEGISWFATKSVRNENTGHSKQKSNVLSDNMGANQSNKIEEYFGGAREYVGQSDVKEQRVLAREAFVRAIQQFKARNNELFAPKNAKSADNEALDADAVVAPTLCFEVIARKRPLNEAEMRSGDFDVVSSGLSAISRDTIDKEGESDSFSSFKGKEAMWVHKCCFRLDARHMYIENHMYPFDKVFDEEKSSHDVFNESVRPKIEHAINQSSGGGGKAAIIMYGATGSGKTFTMNSLFSYTADFVFNCKSRHRGVNVATGSYILQSVTLYACEVSGSKVRDLFSNDNITLMEDGSGVTNWLNCSSKIASSADELVELFKTCCASRVTKATGVHDSSSRTHAIYKLVLSLNWVGESHNDIASTASAEIIYTDLAGSEWSRDQVLHDSSRIQEARDINSSLMVFKQCVINANQNSSDSSKIPYRESKLTRILKDCFVNPSNLMSTLVITTISPSSRDSEHTQDGLSQTCRSNIFVSGDIGTGAEAANSDAVKGNNGHKIITTNLDSLAVVNGKGSSYGDAENSSERSCGGGDSREIGLKTANLKPHDGLGLNSHPSNWTSEQVAAWFETTSAQICEEIRLEMEKKGTTDTNLFHNVVLSAKKWVALRQEGKDSIGLAFVEASPSNTDSSSADPSTSLDAPLEEAGSPYLKVSKVLSKGYATMCRPVIKPGWEISSIQGMQYTSRVEYSNAFKDVLKNFKSSLTKHREYEESKVKFMTQDMKVLREYIMNGPSALYAKENLHKRHKPQEESNLEDKHGGGKSGEPTDTDTSSAPPSIESSDATSAPLNPASDQNIQNQATDPSLANDDVSEPLAPVAPPDYLIRLRFRERLPVSVPVVPDVPRIFTGESRLGTIWTGVEFVEKYGVASGAMAKFTLACDGNERLGKRMHEELRKLI